MENIIDLISDSSEDTVILEEETPQSSTFNIDVIVNKYAVAESTDNLYLKKSYLNIKPSSNKSDQTDAKCSSSDILEALTKKYQNYVFSSYEDFSNTNFKKKLEEGNKNNYSDEKELMQKQKTEERQKKKKEKDIEKAKKVVLAANNKHFKPEQSLKFIVVNIDKSLTEVFESNLLDTLNESQISFNDTSQIVPNTISWTQIEQHHSLDDEGNVQITSTKHEIDEVILVMHCKELIELVYEQKLTQYINSLKNLLNKKLTLCIYELDLYYKYHKNEENNELRAAVTDSSQSLPKGHNKFKNIPVVSKAFIEDALLEMHLLETCNYHMIYKDLGKIIVQYTKAFAELRYKQLQDQNLESYSWYAPGDNKNCVKIDKNGNGLKKLWIEMLANFPLSSLEIAQAICNKYSSLKLLLEAYDSCETCLHGEQLLQEIPIRRAAGHLANVRKVGPELSKKIYYFFTSLNDNLHL